MMCINELIEEAKKHGGEIMKIDILVELCEHEKYEECTKKKVFHHT